MITIIYNIKATNKNHTTNNDNVHFTFQHLTE